jgi:dipeptidyl aminopeptidase/acylaminoacyl peptidase
VTPDPALLGAGLGAGLWGLHRLVHHAILHGLRAPRVPHGGDMAALGLPPERLLPVQLPGPGGRRLAAWLALPQQRPAAGAPAVLAMHGWGANASMMSPVVAPLLAAGIAVLLLDARCHGDSDDEVFTSVPRFAEDIDAGLRWLRRCGGIDGRRIALLGHSVGAAAALLHASRADAAAGVQAVVSLSAFAHPQEMMRRWLAEHRLPYPVIGWYVLRHVQRVIGARFDDIAPLHTVVRVACPVLLVHGHDDRIVPFSDALRLQRAARAAELLAVAGEHDLRETLRPHAAAIVDFLLRALADPGGAPRTGQAGEHGDAPAGRPGGQGVRAIPAPLCVAAHPNGPSHHA